MNKKQILVTVDGSEQSMEAVRYVSGFFSPKQIEVTLYHVFSKMPEESWDLNNYPGYVEAMISVQSVMAERKKEMQTFMDNARKLFTDAGFPENAVTVAMPERRVGITRDISFKAQQGYESVVIGRTGLSRIKDLVVGSTAFKLIGRVSDVPVWVVEGKPETKNVVIAIDNSRGAMHAIDFAGTMLEGLDAKVCLLNVQRVFSFFESDDDQVHSEEVRDQMIESILDIGKSRLVDAGVKKENITIKICKDVYSRSATIVEEAEQFGAGTIILGRRGISRVKEFFIGRVSNKVIHLARNQAVWVVG